MENSEISKANFLKLAQDIRKSKVILWVGAGFSAYAGYLTGAQLCNHLKKIILLEFNENISSTDLSEVASFYILKKGRKELENELVKLYSAPPSNPYIHESLSQLRHFPYIITTNYDQLFEITYGDNLFSITDEKFIPNSPKRNDKVILLKIHGDVDNPSKMVISKEDYQTFDDNSLLWSKLSSICAEYSVLFIGYSIQDTNVLNLLQFITNRLRDHRNPYYLISRTIDEEKVELLNKWGLLGIEMITTEVITRIFHSITNNSLINMSTDSSEIPMLLPIFEKEGVKLNFLTDGKTCKHISILPKQSENLIEINGKIKARSDNEGVIKQLISCITGETIRPVTITKDTCQISICANVKNINLFNVKNGSEFSFDSLTFTPHPTGKKIVDITTSNDSTRLRNCCCEIYEGTVERRMVISHNFLKISILYKEQEGSDLSINIPFISDVGTGLLVYNILFNWINGNFLIIIPEDSDQIIQLPSPSHITSQTRDLITFGFSFLNKLSCLETKKQIKFQIPEEFQDNDIIIVEILYRIINDEIIQLNNFEVKLAFLTNNTPLKEILTSNSTSLHEIIISQEINIFAKKIPLDLVIQYTIDDILNKSQTLHEIQQDIIPITLQFINKSGKLGLHVYGIHK